MQEEQEAFEAQLRAKDAEMEIERVKANNLDTVLERVKEDVALKTHDVNKRHCFSLYHKNNGQPRFQYVTLRTQRDGLARSLKRLRSKYPNSKLVLQIPYNPNAFNLFLRMKEQLKPGVHFYRNELHIEGHIS